MKKILLCIIGLFFTIMTLTACDSSSPGEVIQSSESVNNALSAIESSKPLELPSVSSTPEKTESTISSPESSESAFLSVDEAILIYNTWLDNHDEVSSYTLDKQYYQTFDILGEQYYCFNADDPIRYWYNILIHMQTGELLFMMKSDGEYPATSIEPLENWYSSTYAFG